MATVLRILRWGLCFALLWGTSVQAEETLPDLEPPPGIDTQWTDTPYQASEVCGANCRTSCCNCCAPWQGFYIGSHTGYGWSETTNVENVAGSTDFHPLGLESVLGGVHLGYNWQRHRWVYGLEADWTEMSLEDRFVSGGGNVTRGLEIPWLATVRGRVGHCSDQVMVYATAGVGFTDTETFFDNPAPGTASDSASDSSLVAGGGMEMLLGRGWSGRIEYLWVDYDPSIDAKTGFDEGGNDSDGIFTTRIGLTRRLGSGAVSSGGLCCGPRCHRGCCQCSPWSGFYVGAHTGYASTETTFVEPAGGGGAPDVTVFDADQAIGGIHLGYNWQCGNYVAGLEGDWTELDLDRTVITGNGNVARSVEVAWLQTVRGRLGYRVGRVLSYATAGIAFVETGSGFRNPSTTSGQSAFDTSFTAGGGMELAVGCNWAGRVEYLWVDHDPSIGTHAGFTEGSVSADGIHLVRVGVSRTFGGCR